MKPTPQVTSNKLLLKRAINELARSLPPIQYTSKGIITGDDVVDSMRLRRDKGGERIEREAKYVVNRYHFTNHKRALRKLMQTAKSQPEFQSSVLQYVANVRQQSETQTMLAKKPTLWQRIKAFFKSLFFNY